jgi:potassium intermediate/small conductance calcium-activated channel subfamily N protein 2
LRTFELLYWETKDKMDQDWEYSWNAMWCIFVSMTTVGYGDYYSKTQIGRVISIIACIIGIYFVSMMMVFMTQKAYLNEKEYKAYKLVSRLNLRNQIRDIQSYVVQSVLKMAIYTKQKAENELENEIFEIKYNYEKRKINNYIQQIKENNRIIESFDLITTNEHLFDISERIESDIREIKNEQKTLHFINETLIQFTDSLIDINQYLKKNIHATEVTFFYLGAL